MSKAIKELTVATEPDFAPAVRPRSELSAEVLIVLLERPERYNLLRPWDPEIGGTKP